MKRAHSFQVRKRAFVIWQKLGFYPWKKPVREDGKKDRKSSGDFYRGAFDSIPFLNRDAKRTFQHLLLRPGYMIRDYIRGNHENYLAPLTALIVFYAFFALLSSVLQPVRTERRQFYSGDDISLEWNGDTLSTRSDAIIRDILKIVKTGYVYLHLDENPEEVHTRQEAALATLESTLRSQGIPLFLGKFFLLWLAMSLSLRRFKMRMSACAAASAYILCQFSFFMLFALLLSWGKDASISIALMSLLLVWDYRQWLDLSWGKSIRRTVSTGIWYGLIFVFISCLIGGLATLIAFLRQGVLT